MSGFWDVMNALGNAALAANAGYTGDYTALNRLNELSKQNQIGSILNDEPTNQRIVTNDPAVAAKLRQQAYMSKLQQLSAIDPDRFGGAYIEAMSPDAQLDRELRKMELENRREYIDFERKKMANEVAQGQRERALQDSLLQSMFGRGGIGYGDVPEPQPQSKIGDFDSLMNELVPQAENMNSMDATLPVGNGIPTPDMMAAKASQIISPQVQEQQQLSRFPDFKTWLSQHPEAAGAVIAEPVKGLAKAAELYNADREFASENNARSIDNRLKEQQLADIQAQKERQASLSKSIDSLVNNEPQTAGNADYTKAVKYVPQDIGEWARNTPEGMAAYADAQEKQSPALLRAAHAKALQGYQETKSRVLGDTMTNALMTATQEMLNDPEAISRITGLSAYNPITTSKAGMKGVAYSNMLKDLASVKTLQEAREKGFAPGTITEREWPKFQNAIVLLNNAVSEEEYTKNLQRLNDILWEAKNARLQELGLPIEENPRDPLMMRQSKTEEKSNLNMEDPLGLRQTNAADNDPLGIR